MPIDNGGGIRAETIIGKGVDGQNIVIDADDYNILKYMDEEERKHEEKQTSLQPPGQAKVLAKEKVPPVKPAKEDKKVTAAVEQDLRNRNVKSTKK
jgi:hypothetical protein